MLTSTNFEQLNFVEQQRLKNNEFLPVEKRMALSSRDYCRATDGSYYCTLPAGHEGRKHIAHYSEARIAREW